jgi:hypothetical protein
MIEPTNELRVRQEIAERISRAEQRRTAAKVKARRKALARNGIEPLF